jgi:hypothetical protein
MRLVLPRYPRTVVGDLGMAMWSSQRSRYSATLDVSVTTAPLVAWRTNAARTVSACFLVPQKVRVAWREFR